MSICTVRGAKLFLNLLCTKPIVEKFLSDAAEDVAIVNSVILIICRSG
jgi:hypothetical protein